MSAEKTARDAIFTLAQGAVTADGSHSLGVVFDVPSASSTPDDVVAVGRTERVVTSFAMVGSMVNVGALMDEITVHVVVEVFRAGYDPQAVFDRAADLVASVEGAVRADPTLGGAVYVARPAQGAYECQASDNHSGLIGSYELSIVCKAID